MGKTKKITITETAPKKPIDVSALVKALREHFSGFIGNVPIDTRLFFDIAWAFPAFEAKHRGRPATSAFLVYNPRPGVLSILFDGEIKELAEGFDPYALALDIAAVEEAAPPEKERREVEVKDGARITTFYYESEGDEADLTQSLKQFKTTADIHALLRAALTTLPSPAILGAYTDENGYLWASEDLVYGKAPLAFSDEFSTFLTTHLTSIYRQRGWRIVEPPVETATTPSDVERLFVPVASDVITMVGGRAGDIQSRLTRRGTKGLKNPEYQRALAENAPLVQPALSNAGWPMLLYLVVYTTLAIKGETGVYEGGDFVYVNKEELYDVIGAGRLDYRTRRDGLTDISLPREYIAGHLGGKFYEYLYRPGGFLTKVVHIDETLIRENRRREFKAYMLHPLYWALIRDAARKHLAKGGVLYIPVDRLDALLDIAVRHHDQNYAGLSRGFIDVLRNRTKREFKRNLTTALELYGLTSYDGRGAATLDAVRRKMDILGEAGILSEYDLRDDSIILYPHPALSRGETKGLFDGE